MVVESLKVHGNVCMPNDKETDQSYECVEFEIAQANASIIISSVICNNVKCESHMLLCWVNTYLSSSW